MTIAILKYNAGNTYSVVNALRRLGAAPVLTDDAAVLLHADRVILPGQGNAATVMDYLRAKGLDRVVGQLQQPVLGICVGMQILCRTSEEGAAQCMGVFDAAVRRFRATAPGQKIPVMGWNSLHGLRGPLFEGIDEGTYAYFIHSFYAPVAPQTTATADYILPYSAAMQRGNFYATQFHPEKSGTVGERILRNFLNL